MPNLNSPWHVQNPIRLHKQTGSTKASVSLSEHVQLGGPYQAEFLHADQMRLNMQHPCQHARLDAACGPLLGTCRPIVRKHYTADRARHGSLRSLTCAQASR